MNMNEVVIIVVHIIYVVQLQISKTCTRKGEIYLRKEQNPTTSELVSTTALYRVCQHDLLQCIHCYRVEADPVRDIGTM